jgi:hypothetical protein
MTPTWAVILVGLGSAVVGSLLTTLMTISHERAAELRKHMLDAADEYSTTAMNALEQLRLAGSQVDKAKGRIYEAEELKSDLTETFEAARAATDAVRARQARVHLLFGAGTPTGIAATEVYVQLRRMWSRLDLLTPRADLGRPVDYREEGSRWRPLLTNAEREHMAFNQAALEALNSTTWSRLTSRKRAQQPPVAIPRRSATIAKADDPAVQTPVPPRADEMPNSRAVRIPYAPFSPVWLHGFGSTMRTRRERTCSGKHARCLPGAYRGSCSS